MTGYLLRLSGALLLLALVLAACSPGLEGDEQARVHAQLKALVEAVEEGSPGDIQDLLAEDFSGPNGMDRARARAYASLMLRRYESPRVRWNLEEMDLQGDRARVRASVLITGSAQQIPGIGLRGRWMDVEMGWRLDGRDWKMVSARWSGRLE